MAAAVGSAGLSDDLAFGYASGRYATTPGIANPVSSSRKKPSFFKATTPVSDEYSAGALSSTPRSYKQPTTTLRSLDTSNMSSYTTTSTLAAPPRSDSRQKLHKRGGSGSSSHGGAHSQFITPFATYEEPDLSSATPTPSSSTPKIKPYLRKISKKEDPEQGRVDLSKSVSENTALAGLGIQDFGTRARTASDVTFSHTGRRTPHTRTTSVGSQVSTASGSYRPTPAFVHPMSKTPNRPYTPPTTEASSVVDDEVRESSDILIDDDAQFGPGFRTQRSMSLSSTPQVPAPTPLSQSYTAANLGAVPKLTSPSVSNLSIRSGRSGKSSRSKLGLGRMRTDTNRSADFIANSPSTRTSVDKPFSFISRRSDTDPLSRDDRIRAARRKFDEKEAKKDDKIEKRQETDRMKQERRRRKSEAASERSRISKSNSKKVSRDGRKRSDVEPEITALPRHRGAGAVSEKGAQKEKESQGGGGWSRFTGWLLPCVKDDS